jgi:hypothetical protein
VDRSNGFEKKWLSNQSNKASLKELEYKWRVEDL